MRLLLAFTLSLILSGCATIHQGYFSRVEILHAPDSLRVYTIQGVEIPVQTWTDRTRKYTPGGEVQVDLVDSTRSFISVRSGTDHVLVLSDGKSERRYALYGKIDSGWAILDFLLGVLPGFIDAITGNWNFFDPIDYGAR